jgi:hypothetical protein
LVRQPARRRADPRDPPGGAPSLCAPDPAVIRASAVPPEESFGGAPPLLRRRTPPGVEK